MAYDDGTTVIHKTDRYAIRIKEENGTVSVYVDAVRDGAIYIPLGYMLGSNALHYEIRPRLTKGVR